MRTLLNTKTDNKYIYLCPPQLHEQRVNNWENTNLKDVLTDNPATTFFKQAEALQDKQFIFKPRMTTIVQFTDLLGGVEETVSMMFLGYLSTLTPP